MKNLFIFLYHFITKLFQFQIAINFQRFYSNPPRNPAKSHPNLQNHQPSQVNNHETVTASAWFVGFTIDVEKTYDLLKKIYHLDFANFTSADYYQLFLTIGFTIGVCMILKKMIEEWKKQNLANEEIEKKLREFLEQGNVDGAKRDPSISLRPQSPQSPLDLPESPLPPPAPPTAPPQAPPNPIVPHFPPNPNPIFPPFPHHPNQQDRISFHQNVRIAENTRSEMDRNRNSNTESNVNLTIDFTQNNNNNTEVSYSLTPRSPRTESPNDFSVIRDTYRSLLTAHPNSERVENTGNLPLETQVSPTLESEIQGIPLETEFQNPERIEISETLSTITNSEILGNTGNSVNFPETIPEITEPRVEILGTLITDPIPNPENIPTEPLPNPVIISNPETPRSAPLELPPREGALRAMGSQEELHFSTASPQKPSPTKMDPKISNRNPDPNPLEKGKGKVDSTISNRNPDPRFEKGKGDPTISNRNPDPTHINLLNPENCKNEMKEIVQLQDELKKSIEMINTILKNEPDVQDIKFLYWMKTRINLCETNDERIMEISIRIQRLVNFVQKQPKNQLKNYSQIWAEIEKINQTNTDMAKEVSDRIGKLNGEISHREFRNLLRMSFRMRFQEIQEQSTNLNEKTLEELQILQTNINKILDLYYYLNQKMLAIGTNIFDMKEIRYVVLLEMNKQKIIDLIQEIKSAQKFHSVYEFEYFNMESFLEIFHFDPKFLLFFILVSGILLRMIKKKEICYEKYKKIKEIFSHQFRKIKSKFKK